MEGELPSVKNNVTLQVAAKSTTFKNWTIFVRCKGNVKARALDSLSSGKYVSCGSGSLLWRGDVPQFSA